MWPIVGSAPPGMTLIKCPHHIPTIAAALRRSGHRLLIAGAVATVGGNTWSAAEPGTPANAMAAAGAQLTDALRAEVHRMAQDAALAVWGSSSKAPRVDVTVGALASNLKLAPCSQVVPYLPAGTRPLGRSRIGLRCTQGGVHWNVSVPVTVRLWGNALVVTASLPAGTVLEAQHLSTAEVDLAERSDAALGDAAQATGRTLQRSLAAGEALRQGDLRARQLFSAGDTVRIVAVGPGYAVSSEGQALGAGLEGQAARVRTEGGRIISGTATGGRRVEVPL